eukprot:s1529_g9.t1
MRVPGEVAASVRSHISVKESASDDVDQLSPFNKSLAALVKLEARSRMMQIRRERITPDEAYFQFVLDHKKQLADAEEFFKSVRHMQLLNRTAFYIPLAEVQKRLKEDLAIQHRDSLYEDYGGMSRAVFLDIQ